VADDIVERLQTAYLESDSVPIPEAEPLLYAEAADEIERLRADIHDLTMWIERLIGDGCECPIGTPSRIPACDYCGYQNWLEDRD
jgi:hypothetical protein